MRHQQKGAVVMITGAAGGIGQAVARDLLEHGYCVSLGARSVNSLERVFGRETPERKHACFDALDPRTASDWVDGTVKQFGRIDALVNCAGLAERVTLWDDNDEALDRLWAVNAKSPLRMTRLCIPHLEKTGRGRIVNLASLSGKRVRNSAVGYAMTKYALMAVTHSTRTLTWDKGIRCTAICPGWVRTPMSDNAKNPSVSPEDMITPDSIAHLVRTAIELPNSAAVAELSVNCEFEDLF